MTLFSPERAKKSVLEEFEKFRSKIEPTEQEKNAISASHTRIRSILENSIDINVVDSFLTGSYARQTMIKPLKDVDFFVQVHYGEHKNDNSMQLLQKLRKALRKAYPLTPMTITLPCVTVKFRYCHFEVVPAIAIKGNVDLFEIPAEKRIGWQKTYPKIPDKWMTQENKKAGGLFIPTIKILKRWRDIHCRPLRSFHLEMLARMAFEHYKIENYVEGVWAFFARTNYLMGFHKRLPFVQEPGRANIYVDQYLYDNFALLEAVRRKIAAHYGFAQRAFDYMNRGRTAVAKQQWRNILGSSFYTSSTLLTTPPLSSLSTPPLSSFFNSPKTSLPSFLSDLLKRKNNPNI
jgi:hypothetical protein